MSARKSCWPPSWGRVLDAKDHDGLTELIEESAAPGASLWDFADDYPRHHIRNEVHPIALAARAGWSAGVQRMLREGNEPRGEADADRRAHCVWQVAERAIETSDEALWAIVEPFLGRRSRGGFCDPGEPFAGACEGGKAWFPLIHLAASAGFLPAIETLIRRGQARRWTTKNKISTPQKQTALMFAAFSGRQEAFGLLAPHSDLDARDTKGSTALLCAASSNEEGAASIVAQLATPQRARQRDNGGQTALMRAAERGRIQSARILAAMSNVDAQDHHGQTAADFAFARALAPNGAGGAEAMRMLGFFEASVAKWVQKNKPGLSALKAPIALNRDEVADFVAMANPQAAAQEESFMAAAISRPERFPRFSAWTQRQELERETALAAKSAETASGAPAPPAKRPGGRL